MYHFKVINNKQTKKKDLKISISYCFGILDVVVLEDTMKVHPSKIKTLIQREIK